MRTNKHHKKNLLKMLIRAMTRAKKIKNAVFGIIVSNMQFYA